MALTLSLFLNGVVVSSVFLMTLSLPKIISVLIGTTMRMRFLKVMSESKPTTVRTYIARWMPASLSGEWQKPKQVVNLLSLEIGRLHDLYASFIECGTAAFLLTIGGIYFGVDDAVRLLVIILVLILVITSVFGVALVISYLDRLKAQMDSIGSLNDEGEKIAMAPPVQVNDRT